MEFTLGHQDKARSEEDHAEFPRKDQENQSQIQVALPRKEQSGQLRVYNDDA